MMTTLWILVLTLVGCWCVARAIDWYPAHLAQEDQLMVDMAVAHQRGDTVAVEAMAATQLSGWPLLRDFLRAPPARGWSSLIGALLALLLAGCVVTTYGATLAAVCWLLFGWGLIVLAFVDARTKLLPDALTFPLLWLGVVVQLFPETRSVGLTASIWGVIAGYLPMWLVAQLYRLLRGRDGLGFGDLKLLAAMGAWSGVAILPGTVLIAAISALIAQLSLRLLRRDGNDWHAEFPFGPWIIAAYLICLATGFTLTPL